MTRRSRLLLLLAALPVPGFVFQGPPALMPLVGAVSVAAATEGWADLRRMVPVLGLAAFAGLGLGRDSAMVIRDPALAQHFLQDELLGRVAEDVRGAGRVATFEGPIASGELYRVTAAFREAAP
jgi:hypothetical protein